MIDAIIFALYLFLFFLSMPYSRTFCATAHIILYTKVFHKIISKRDGYNNNDQFFSIRRREEFFLEVLSTQPRNARNLTHPIQFIFKTDFYGFRANFGLSLAYVLVLLFFWCNYNITQGGQASKHQMVLYCPVLLYLPNLIGMEWEYNKKNTS